MERTCATLVVMSATVLSRALRAQREVLAARWRGRFVANNAATGRAFLDLPVDLAESLLGEVILLLDSDEPSSISTRHHARAFTSIAGFSPQVVLCIDAYQAGAQVIGAFVVENAGSRAAWTISVRNRFLGELDAIFHVLVHREIEALCRLHALESEDANSTNEGTSCAIQPAILEFSEDALFRN